MTRRVIEMRQLWIGLLVWFVADAISLIWISAAHAIRHFGDDFAVMFFLIGAQIFSEKVKK